MQILGMFVKQPVPGLVKTRLAQTIGMDAAAELYSAFVDDLIDRFRTTADQRWLAYSPDETSSRTEFSCRGPDYRLWPQPDTDLGLRIQSFFDAAFAAGADRVVLIGSDSPTLPRAIIQQAFGVLSENEVVFGPATDGGYYLVGQSRGPHRLFDEIAWSTNCVLEQSVERTRKLGLSIATLPPWYDIDDETSLATLRGHLATLRAANADDVPPRTFEWLMRSSVNRDGSG